MSFAWLKGHGTENDFVLLPDHDGTVHGELDGAFVAALCHRRRGIGADGVIRVVRSEALRNLGGHETSAGEWFMDYRNADGSVSEMCGNGIRVFALHLAQEGLVDPTEPLVIGTRDGDKTVTFRQAQGAGGAAQGAGGAAQGAGGAAQGATVGDQISVDMGKPEVRGVSKVTVDGHTWEAQDVRTGNPHAVTFVERLGDAGSLLDEPDYDHSTYPDGVNIEFVVRKAPQHVAMRVHERGSGETRSCGTGACAVAAATAHVDGAVHPVTYRVDVPGGTVHVTWTADDHLILTGPAEIVAHGDMEWTA